MWQPGILSVKNIESINCSVLSAMPYLSNGKKHLTPANAADMILQRAQSADLIFCIMITATTESSFINKIQSLSDCWALPDFKKALRISQTLANLDSNKMIIPAPDVSVCSFPLSAPQSRAIEASKKIGQVKSLNISAMQNNINNFADKQKKLIDETKKKSSSIAGAMVKVDYYFGFSNELKKDIPNENHSFTFMACFTGADIIKLTRLIA